MSTCKKCGVELTDANWYASLRKTNVQKCKSCHNQPVSARSGAPTRRVARVVARAAAARPARRVRRTEPTLAPTGDAGMAIELLGVVEDVLGTADPIALRLIRIARSRLGAGTTSMKE